ncbi:MAG: solute carrier family 26 protein [Bacteroidota bacterium]
MRISDWIPALSWLPRYQRAQLLPDLTAGVTVGVMLIPQGMAYALIAGLPAIYGLYAATIPLLIYAVLGTSRQLAVGPAALVALLTASGVGTLAEAGTETYIAVAIGLAFLVGLIQLLMGLLRLGFIANFLSAPVLTGFTSAAALIIGLSQLKHLLGIDLPRSQYVHEILISAAKGIQGIHWLSLAIGIGGMLVIKGVKRIHRLIPGALIAVILGIVLVWLFGWENAGVQTVGTVPEGLPAWKVPDWGNLPWQEMVPIALAIGLISFIESIAIAKAMHQKHRNYELRPNQELIAMGLSKIGGAFFQAFPTTGGLSRTAVNDQSGAKSGLASLISAGVVIITLLFLTPWFSSLPKPILASIIMLAVWGLLDLQKIRSFWRIDRMDFWLAVVSFLGTLAFGIQLGIGLGVLLSLAMVIFRSSRPHFAVLGKVPNSHHYRNIERFSQLEDRADLLIFRFDGPLYFANVAFFKENLELGAEQKGASLQAIILNAESINRLDSSGLQTLEEVSVLYGKRGIRIFFAGFIGPVRDVMTQSRLFAQMSSGIYFMGIQEAVDFWDADDQTQVPRPFREYVTQHNSEPESF